MALRCEELLEVKGNEKALVRRKNNKRIEFRKTEDGECLAAIIVWLQNKS